MREEGLAKRAAANQTCEGCDRPLIQIKLLFDYDIRESENLRWQLKAERARGFQIDHQLELRRLDDRQVAGPFALQNPANIDPSWRFVASTSVP
jgi:hypothetical protein